MLRELKGRMRAFRNMHGVTVLNVPQLRELSVSVAFVDVKEVKLENASLLGKCEELKRVVEKNRRKKNAVKKRRKENDDVVVNMRDVSALPVEKSSNNCCNDEIAYGVFAFVIVCTLVCFVIGIISKEPIFYVISIVLMVIAFMIGAISSCCRN